MARGPHPARWPKSARLPEQESARLVESPWLHVSPNPTNGPVQLVCALPEGAERAELTIRDAQGRLVEQRRLAAPGGIFDIDTRAWANGTYLIGLTVDGIKAGSAKLQRVR